ncbi:MAG: SPOR domain-containing protein [Pseudomonadota bacterium]
MSQESNDKLRRFAQKMRDQGADGFADGPRPWETWDESGNQANNRVWEGSARRVNGKYNKHSLGHRILSVLAFMMLATLLVGIGGVYYTHTQTQQIADSGIQPLPVIAPPDSKVTVAAVTVTENLNILTPPSAGSEAMQPDAEAAVETAVSDNGHTPATDEPVPDTTIDVTPATAPETVPPKTNGSIDSVAIETVVTEQSITTTVYTRHPSQDEPEIVSAIETTPPPFAQQIAATQQDVTDAPPAAHTDTLVLAEVETIDTPEVTPLHEEQYDIVPDEQPADLAGTATTAALAEESSESVATARLANTVTEAIEGLPDTAAGKRLTEETIDVTTVALAEESNDSDVTEPLVEAAPEVTDDQPDAIADAPSIEKTDAVTTVALAEENRETAIDESPAETAQEVIEEQQSNIVEPVIPVTKTGNWVVNVASYTWKSTASRKLALFQQQGVNAEIFKVMINDKPMYRVRVTGYESSRQAKAEIPEIEQKLNLEGAWISRR